MVLQMLSKIPFPHMSVTGMGLCSLVAIFICPRTLGANVLFPGFRLLFGTLYPAYASYKAVRTKNVKEYVKWMMYWIVFAFFTCIETFTDILLSWFPFYYEIKVILVLWLLSPATRGSSTLYRKFVHPMLTRREQEIDDYINQAKEKGYTAVLQLGSKGVNYATNVIMQTAIKAFNAPVLPGSMIRHSQSDDALASAIHSKRTHSLGDETDGDLPLGARLQSTSSTSTTSQADGPSRNSRVTRSQSVDSALSKVGRSSQQQPAVQHPLNQSIIYEIDSEEEDHLLMAAQNTTAGDRLLHPEAMDFEKESSAELEEGSARARATQKRKTATTTGVTRGRKASSASTGSTTSTTAAKTTAARGRKKLRKDSESMEVEVD
uniref:Receptor expression-enhancing protein n=2 Tax=Culex tarsalis TaxID=7177 RepID=A0A1Q3F676_CULTA